MAYNNYFPMGYQQFPQQYQQQMSQPQMNQFAQPAQQNNGIVWVQGIEGAKAHPVNAGQSALLMDSEGDCFYLKSADQMGMPSLRVFDYKERTNTPQKAENADISGFITQDKLDIYVTKEDLKTAILGLKKELTEKKGKKVKDDE